MVTNVTVAAGYWMPTDVPEMKCFTSHKLQKIIAKYIMKIYSATNELSMYLDKIQ